MKRRRLPKQGGRPASPVTKKKKNRASKDTRRRLFRQAQRDGEQDSRKTLSESPIGASVDFGAPGSSTPKSAVVPVLPLSPGRGTPYLGFKYSPEVFRPVGKLYIGGSSDLEMAGTYDNCQLWTISPGAMISFYRYLGEIRVQCCGLITRVTRPLKFRRECSV